MASQVAARRAARTRDDIRAELRAELPAGAPDEPRDWCASCGLADPPTWRKLGPPTGCPRCGSLRRWHGRIADRDGTAAGPPDDGTCRECYEWRRYPPGQEHFGWAWRRICHLTPAPGPLHCGHAHHDGEIWLAAL